MPDKPKSLEDMIKDLPPDLYQTALDYLQFLTKKRGDNAGDLQVDWQGAVADLRDPQTPPFLPVKKKL